MSSRTLEALNQLQQELSTRDFENGTELSIVGELLCESVPVLARDRVLDIGTASGKHRPRCSAGPHRHWSILPPLFWSAPNGEPPPKTCKLTFNTATRPRSLSRTAPSTLS